MRSEKHITIIKHLTNKNMTNKNETMTPGQIARKSNKVKTVKVKSAAKRYYTPRGTSLPAKRVVLIDGVPVGRGRPSSEVKNRTVVYIPVNEKYNREKHGIGVKYSATNHPALSKRVSLDGKVLPKKAVVPNSRTLNKQKSVKVGVAVKENVEVETPELEQVMA